jgi:fatty acid desaturase
VGAQTAKTKRKLSTADRVAIFVGLIALALGVALLAFSSGFTASIIGACLFGLAGIAFVALVFLLVGESEDRDYGNGAP